MELIKRILAFFFEWVCYTSSATITPLGLDQTRWLSVMEILNCDS